MSSRKPFIVVLSLSLLAAPVTAGAQPPRKVPRIGYLVLAPLLEKPSPERAAFLEALSELGYVEGKTVSIEYRSAGWNAELLPDLAEELVRLNVDAIVTGGGGATAEAARQATKTIPIVVAASADPVGLGLVASLARPGGNITGTSLMAPELGSKRLELLKETVPKISRVAVLWHPRGAGRLEWQQTEAAARRLGVTLQSYEVRNADDVARALEAMTKKRPDAVIMFFDPLTSGYRVIISDFALKNRLPTIFGSREFAAAGGLMSYGPNIPELFRRAAVYVDKILKGAKPRDLPIEQPTKFELIVNLKTAKALGLTIPPSVLIRADQVVQ
ncbi:MAG: ABC transporter substrate-binding protein [Candidatus Rokuibacteriota bacterium]